MTTRDRRHRASSQYGPSGFQPSPVMVGLWQPGFATFMGFRLIWLIWLIWWIWLMWLFRGSKFSHTSFFSCLMSWMDWDCQHCGHLASKHGWNLQMFLDIINRHLSVRSGMYRTPRTQDFFRKTELYRWVILGRFKLLSVLLYNVRIYIYMYTVYIYIYMCVCVCVYIYIYCKPRTATYHKISRF